MRNTIFLIFSICLILSGCANPLLNTIQNTNKSLEKKQLPYRYVGVEKKESYTTFQLELAGTPQQASAISDNLLLSDIYNALKLKCGFEKEDIVEVRKVVYNPPLYYEVWVFNDEQSKRPDKRSGLSVLLSAPVLGSETNEHNVEISFAGNCHSEPKQFIFAN